MDRRKRVHLSRGVMDMKFMKKSKEKVECLAEEGESKFPDTFESARRNMVIFNELSNTSYYDLIDGRLSFKGMNPKIEELMNSEYALKLEEAERLKEKDISDIEMAKQFSNLNNTVAKKFQTKGNKSNKKPVFMKPNEVDTLI